MDDFNGWTRSKVEQYPGNDDRKFTGLHDNFFKAIPNGLIFPPERPEFARKKVYFRFSCLRGWRNLKCKNRGQLVPQSSLVGVFKTHIAFIPHLDVFVIDIGGATTSDDEWTRTTICGSFHIFIQSVSWSECIWDEYCIGKSWWWISHAYCIQNSSRCVCDWYCTRN
jgi:hypothetical protein